MMIIVYKLTCKINDKIYIGITANLKHRLSVHFGCYKNTLLSRAIRKYGNKNFNLEIIENIETWEEAYKKEKYYIKYFNSYKPNGYNMTLGGEGQQGLIHSDETRKKMSNSHIGLMIGSKNPMWGKVGINKGKKFSEETKRKISKSKLGSIPWNKGTKGLQSNPNKGKFLTLTNDQIKEIRNIYKTTDLFQEEIAKKFNTSQSVVSKIVSNEIKKGISKRAKEKMSKAKNNKWNGKFINEEHPLSKLDKDKVIKIRELYNVFKYSQCKLAEIYKVSQANISSIIRRKTWKNIGE